MATFYLLPPRGAVAGPWTGYLRQWFPGLADPGRDLADLLAAFAERQPGVFVVFADDLPGGEVRDALRDGFGLDREDQVFDLRQGPMPPLADWPGAPARAGNFPTALATA
jgi:hypothetical protein